MVTKGKFIVITAPSGAGKTTIARHLLQAIPEIAFSVSATTRQIRKNEIEGKDYFFLTAEEFKNRIAHDEFIEWEEVYPGTFYGSLKRQIEKLWEMGKAVLFDVDVKGALNLKNKFPDNTLTIFIKPPSYEVLIQRLKNRATDSPEKIQERIHKAQDELLFESSFDVVIVNDDLEQALREVKIVVGKFLHP
jgi:guanylate kinase